MRSALIFAALAALTVAACDKDALEQPSAAASASAAPMTLSPELAAKPLATVGDRVITLGDYAAVIDRMDPYERLRYQSPERRKQLLDEIIKVELLSREAKKRGLDKEPRTKERVRQILRDELLKAVRAELPSPSDIPEAEVRKYYDAHRAEFRDPERRRVAHLVVGSEAEAKKLLAEAKKATPMQWGKLVQEHSLDKPPAPSATQPLELAGDLGIVGPPGEEKGDNPRVPEELRKAVMEALGRIHAVLDDTQRQRLAEMIDRGRGGWHPFRGGMA